jgi:hypothetical protein
MKYRSSFLREANNIFSRLNTLDLETLQSGLDASKSSKIMSDVITKYQDGWLEFIQKHFFLEEDKFEEFRESYYELKPFKKNLMGNVKAIVKFLF